MEIVTSHNGMKAILQLDESEIKWWRGKIGDVRKRYVLSPKELIQNHINSINSTMFHPIIIWTIFRHSFTQ